MMSKHYYFLSALLTLCACTSSALSPEPDGPGKEERVPVSLRLSTKSDFEPDLDGAAQWQEIRNVAMMQFEWVDDDPANVLDAALVGQKQYFDHWSETGLDAGENFSLVKSSRKNTVFVFANISQNDLSFPVGTTMGSFLEKMNATTIDDLSGLWYTVGTDRYLRMNGSVVLDGVDFGADVGTVSAPLRLQRSCAKVVIKIKNEAPAADNLIIRKVQLCGINRKYYYATDVDGFETFEKYSPQNPLRFDEAPRDLPVDGTLTYYVPVNLRGKNSSESQYDKNRNAPSGATCLKIYATYGPSDVPICYTYYLGADLVSDFNIEANKKYTYEITLTRKGDPDYDSRIEDLGEKRFTVDANCYLMHPPVLEGQSRIYAFPVRRAAVYWNRQGANMGVYDASGTTDSPFTLEETAEWETYVVWNDLYKNGAKVDDFLLTAGGKGFNPDNSNPPAGHDPWIRVKVDEGVRGNALVAVKYNGSIIWSWHLWVTDYDPDVQMTPLAGTYIYNVPGGALHRYNGAIWETGMYSNAFIMDRNLGALAEVGEYESHGFYYEPGRKDPFRHGTSNYTRHDGTVNVLYGVQNPTVFVFNRANAWAYASAKLYSAIENWFDPLIFSHGGDCCEVDKSIYDPCPPGWRIPEKTTFADWRTGSGATRHREWTLSHPGLYYYPEGFENKDATGVIYFPAAGQIWAHNGADNRHWGKPSRGIQLLMNQMKGYTIVTEDVDLVEFRLDANPDGLSSGTGMSVRCVRLQ